MLERHESEDMPRYALRTASDNRTGDLSLPTRVNRNFGSESIEHALINLEMNTDMSATEERYISCS